MTFALAVLRHILLSVLGLSVFSHSFHLSHSPIVMSSSSSASLSRTTHHYYYYPTHHHHLDQSQCSPSYRPPPSLSNRRHTLPLFPMHDLSSLHGTPSPSLSSTATLADKVKSFVQSNWLVLGEILVILLAKAKPHWGATGGPLRPEVFVSKLGVFCIFFINGLSLSLSSTASASSPASSFLRTNALIQSFNFAFIPLIVKALSGYYPDAAFRDGLVALSCLPCTTNVCVAQTLAAGGNMATAIFNAIFANVIGVVITPLLAMTLLRGGTGSTSAGIVSLLATLSKLGQLVILPLLLGQIVRRIPLLNNILIKIRNKTRLLSSFLLLAIVFNVFSDTFLTGIGVQGTALMRLICTMPSYLTFSAIFWALSWKVLPGLDAKTRAAALLCSSQKTLAFGIPFIKTALGSRSDLAYILAPLLMYAPTQLLSGSGLLVPQLQKIIKEEESFNEGGGI